MMPMPTRRMTRASASVRLSAAERAKRLATIDEDAAAEQERVEMIEREYMERLERERAAETPDEQSPPATCRSRIRSIGA